MAAKRAFGRGRERIDLLRSLAVDILLQLIGEAPEFLERADFDLPHGFRGDPQLVSDFLQRVAFAACKGESVQQYLPFFLLEAVEEPEGVLLMFSASAPAQDRRTYPPRRHEGFPNLRKRGVQGGDADGGVDDGGDLILLEPDFLRDLQESTARA